jgi:fatty acid desaturase
MNMGMVGHILSVVFPVLVAISVRMCGKRITTGWLVGFIAQLAYGCFALVTGNWMGMINLIIVAPIFWQNYHEWRATDKERESVVR